MKNYFLDLIGYTFVFIAGGILSYLIFNQEIPANVKTEYVETIKKSDVKIDSINKVVEDKKITAQNLVEKSNKIKLRRDSIKIVVKDTILLTDVKEVSEKISLYEQDLIIKDSIIYVKDLTILDMDNIIKEQDNKLSIKDDYIKNIEKIKSKKKSKIVIGPTIGYGFSTGDNKLKPFVGVGLTLNIF